MPTGTSTNYVNRKLNMGLTNVGTKFETLRDTIVPLCVWNAYNSDYLTSLFATLGNKMRMQMIQC